MSNKKDYLTQNIYDIAFEMNWANEKIENIRDLGGFLSFQINGRFYTNKLTPTGKHKKNSVRLSTY